LFEERKISQIITLQSESLGYYKSKVVPSLSSFVSNNIEESGSW